MWYVPAPALVLIPLNASTKATTSSRDRNMWSTLFTSSTPMCVVIDGGSACEMIAVARTGADGGACVHASKAGCGLG